jgi:DNA-binding GntR family transcriptional regulator
MAAPITFQRDSAYEKLLSLIVDGQLLPDQPISERQIAAELKIGRTPVREAMRALAQDGLLEIVPARGTFVRSISDNQLRELYEVRQALEGQAAELAARNGATQKLLEFVGKLERSRKARTDEELGETYETGAQFHVEVFRCAGNSILTTLYLPIRNRFRVTMSLGRYYDSDWVIDGIDQHLTILEAIAARKPSKAKRLMRAHLMASYESKQKILKQINREPKSKPRMAS